MLEAYDRKLNYYKQNTGSYEVKRLTSKQARRIRKKNNHMGAIIRRSN